MAKVITLQKPDIQINVLGNNLQLTTRPAELVVENGNLICRDIDALAYDCEIRGCMWIAEPLRAWAEAQNGYWDWENPETISFTPDTETTFVV